MSRTHIRRARTLAAFSGLFVAVFIAAFGAAFAVAAAWPARASGFDELNRAAFARTARLGNAVRALRRLTRRMA